MKFLLSVTQGFVNNTKDSGNEYIVVTSEQACTKICLEDCQRSKEDSNIFYIQSLTMNYGELSALFTRNS